MRGSRAMSLQLAIAIHCHISLCAVHVPDSTLLPADALRRTHEVFLIHAGPQKELARRLRDAFRDDLGIRAFLDAEDLECGADADVQMRMCLKSAPLGIALLSKQFFNVAAAPRPLAELRMALNSDKLLPVLLRELPHDELRERLVTALQTPVQDPDLLFATGGDRDEFVRKLVRTAALQFDDPDEVAFRHRIAWAAVQKLARYCIGLRPRVTPHMREDYVDLVATLRVALKEVATKQGLRSLSDAEREKARSIVLAMRDCNLPQLEA